MEVSALKNKNVPEVSLTIKYLEHTGHSLFSGPGVCQEFLVYQLRYE